MSSGFWLIPVYISRPMEMHQVRYFLAVARTRNFTRAAEECNVSQPSLTRAIQKLEGNSAVPCSAGNIACRT